MAGESMEELLQQIREMTTPKSPNGVPPVAAWQVEQRLRNLLEEFRLQPEGKTLLEKDEDRGIDLELLLTPVEETDLHWLVRSWFGKKLFYRLHDLVQLTDAEILLGHRIGAVALQELKVGLKKLGLTTNMELDSGLTFEIRRAMRIKGF